MISQIDTLSNFLHYFEEEIGSISFHKLTEEINMTLVKLDLLVVTCQSIFIKKLNAPITFWLDAHSGNQCPLIEELEQIKRHKIKIIRF